MAETREYAKPTDIPGARPITGQKREAALSADQLIEAPDTGFAATAGTGQGGGLVVESGNVIGGGPASPSFGNAAGRDRKSGMIVADRTLEPGDVAPAPNSDRGFGPADPTGLPCTCQMPTSIKGAPADMTWCVVCGGERDRKERPENALKGRRNIAVRAATALSEQDVETITAAAERRAYERLLNDLKAAGVIKE